MDSIHNNYAGFGRRYSAMVLDVVIISFLLIYFANGFADIIFWNLLRSGFYTVDSVQYFLYNFPSFLSRILFLEHLLYLNLDDFSIIELLSNRLSYFIFFPFFLIFIWCYYAGLESSPLQATIGKLAVGLYVTDNNGERISFGRATARYFSKIISNLTLLIGYCLAGWTSKKQALHDMISGCLVLKR